MLSIILYICDLKKTTGQMSKLLYTILLMLAVRMSVLAQTDEAVLPDSIADILENTHHKGAKRFDALDLAVNYLFNEGLFLEAMPFIEEMSVISAERGSSDLHKAMACFYKGSIDLLTDSLPEAYRYFMTAKLLMPMTKGSEDSDLLLMRIDISLASYYMTTKSNYTEAYKCLTEAKELNKTVKSDGYEDLINSNIIKVLNSLGLNEEAISFGKKVSANGEASGIRRFTLYSNIANNYMNVSIDTARMYFDSAFMSTQNRYEEAKTLYSIGLCERLSGDNEAAKELFERCLDDYSGSLSHELTSLLLVENGRALSMQGKNKTALTYINKGISTAHKYGFASIELDGRACKCEILENTKEYRELAYSLMAYHHLKDSIDRLNSADEVAYMMLESQFKDMENKIAHDAQVNDMKRSRLVFIIIIAAVALVSATIIFSLVLSRKRVILKNKELREKTLADELEKQNREMVQQTLVQQQQQDIVSDIVGKLKEMNDGKKGADSNIKNMIGSLEDLGNVSTPEDFEYYFTKTHPDFYKNLSNDYPNLSTSELKLCAYIKLNLPVKDIANICNIAPSSVHQARYRLKKNLGLDNADEINELIAKY